MCGFVGFRSMGKYTRLKEDLPAAANSLSHRGPDDSGIFFNDDMGVGLAHRRLSIIDLSAAGHQPMGSDDGTVHIVYNGEVYNFRAIRSMLESHGHCFRSGTDTEVILKAYQQWGTDCFKRFIGMFALAIWDGRTRTLILARDRLGIKPLFVYSRGDTLVFASELKAIMAFKYISLEIDPEAIPFFLHYQYVPAPRTIFKHTQKLMPGNCLVLNGDSARTEAFWEIPERAGEIWAPDTDETEALHQLDTLLTQAVSDRLVADVPLGALLSGGIDSSTVVALMQKVNPSPVKTFSIGFKEQGYNEAPFASRIAGYLGTDHTELYVTPQEALDVVPRLPDIYDEPFADSSAIPTFLVCRLARSHLTVALSGDGGDEQFAGYVRYWMTDVMSKSVRWLPAQAQHMLSFGLGAIPERWLTKCYQPIREYLPQRFQVADFKDKWRKLLQQLHPMELGERYRMTICQWPEIDIIRLIGRHLPDSHYEALFRQTTDWPVLSRLMRIDQGTYLPDAMLTKVDRASMAISLEVRVPLIDHRILEFTSTLPEHFKYRNGTGKYLLKKLLSKYVPPEMFERPKMGFRVPIDQWLRGSLKSLLLDFLSPERLNRENLFDPEFVSRILKEHLSGRANHQYRLWALLMWEMWRERWLRP